MGLSKYRKKNSPFTRAPGSGMNTKKKNVLTYLAKLCFEYERYTLLQSHTSRVGTREAYPTELFTYLNDSLLYSGAPVYYYLLCQFMFLLTAKSLEIY